MKKLTLSEVSAALTADSPFAAVTRAAYLNDPPEFIRLPKSPARCSRTGMSRAGMNKLVLPNEANGFRPPVKSISLRKKGQLKATRLVDYASLISYLRRLQAEQEVGNKD